jgi:hypothetical protein
VYEAAGYITRAADELRHLRNLDAEFGDSRGIEDDLQLVLRPRSHANTGYSGYRFDSRAHELFDPLPVAMDRPWRSRQELHEEPGERLVRSAATVIAERDDRCFRIPRHRRQLIHAADHLDQRRLHVGADREAQVHPGPARVREGAELLQAIQSLKCALLRLDDLRFDLGGRGRAPGREYRDDGLFDLGKELQRQLDEGVDADETRQQHGDEHAGWVAKRGLGQVHRRSLGVSARYPLRCRLGRGRCTAQRVA